MDDNPGPAVEIILNPKNRSLSRLNSMPESQLKQLTHPDLLFIFKFIDNPDIISRKNHPI